MKNRSELTTEEIAAANEACDSGDCVECLKYLGDCNDLGRISAARLRALDADLNDREAEVCELEMKLRKMETAISDA